MWSLLIPPRCPACGAPGAAPCAACWRELKSAPLLPPPTGVDRCSSLLAYEGAARELVARLKYRNQRDALPWIVDGMAALVSPDVGKIGLVTWAPTGSQRLRQRGFDQAQLLATALAKRLRLPVRPALQRLPGGPQTGRSRADRARGPRFVADRALTGAILVVDDVITSGATLAAAAAALRTGGAIGVDAVTAGRTPLKVPGVKADP